jgi:hypothetical protein
LDEIAVIFLYFSRVNEENLNNEMIEKEKGGHYD